MPTTPRAGARRAHSLPVRIVLRLLAVAVALVVMGFVVATTSSATHPLGTSTSLRTSDVSHHSFRVAWAPVEKARGYVVTVATDKAFTHVAWRSQRLSGTSVTVKKGIDEHTRYHVRVVAVSGPNRGLPSASVSARTTWQAPGDTSRPQVRRVDTAGFTVAWPASARAEYYAVQVATDQKFTKLVKTAVVDKPTLTAAVRDGQTYFVRVVPQRHGLSAPAVVGSVTTPLKVLGKVGKPFAEPVSTDSMTVRWPAATNASGYTIALMKTPKSKATWTTTSTKAQATLTGVNRKKAGLGAVFYLKVVATRYGQTHTTSKAIATTLLPGKTSKKASFTAKVSSYNLLKPSETDAEHRSWEKRYTVAAKALRGLDIVGLQETPWKKFDGARPVVKVAKVAKLSVARHLKSSKPCTTTSEPILYRKSKFTVVACGVQKVSTGNPKRYASWATLKEKRSGRLVFVTNAHLVAYAGAESSRDPRVQKLRANEAKKLLSSIKKHNKHHAPVIVLGDLNSYANRAAVTPIDVLAKGGFVSAEMVAPTRLDADVSSFHGFSAPASSGRHLDHVLVDSRSSVLRYAVRATDAKKAPSDHFQIVASVRVH